MTNPRGCCAAPSLVNPKFPTFKKDSFFSLLTKVVEETVPVDGSRWRFTHVKHGSAAKAGLANKRRGNAWNQQADKRGCAAWRSTADGITLPEFHTPTFHVGGRWSEIAYCRHNNGEPFLWKQIVDALGLLSIVSRILIGSLRGSPQLCEMSKLCSQACC